LILKYVVENKVTLLEHISRKSVNKDEVTDRVMTEYNEMDKGTRILVYKIMLEKFNEKYSDLSEAQKTILKEYINNISNTTKLRDFVNESNKTLSEDINQINPNNF
jgi:hypothetical protein